MRAASCNAGDVQAAINRAASGDTVAIPAGTCRWATVVNWNAPANVTLQGAGSQSVIGGGDATVIIDDLNRTTYDQSVLGITTNASGTFRMTGITFRGSGNSTALTYIGSVVISGDSQQVRLDHLHVENIQYTGITFVGQVYGVIDHSLFDLPGYVGIRFYAGGWGGYSEGDGSWADATSLGSNRFVFVEDNVFNGYGVTGGGVQDSYHGSRFVIRYNTINKGGMQTHPTGGSGRARGTRAWEIYRNRANAPIEESQFNFFFLSSGTGVIWGNDASTGYRSFVTLHSMRRNNKTYSQDATPNGWGFCGTSFSGKGSNWDGNTNTSTGYPCLDQPGRGVSDLLSGAFPNMINKTTGCSAPEPCAWPRQALEPIYEWSNIWSRVPNEPGEIFSVFEPDAMMANRDFYLSTPTFNGSSGTGTGTIANRPSSCTPGVAYWAIDEGEWDSTHDGPDGRLYKCVAPNSWALQYTPYPYPHPLAAADGASASTGGTTGGTTDGTAGTSPGTSDTTAPVPGNSGLIASSINADSATLNWTKATDNMSSQSSLQYEVRLSTSNDIGTVAEAETFGAIAVPYTANINSAVVPGWNPGTTYFFNVIVKDEAGNKASYATKSVTSTVSDSVPPNPGNSGLISSTSTSNSATLNWSRATDDVSAPSALRYEVVLSTKNDINSLTGAETYGAVIKTFTADLVSYLVTGLNPGKTYYFNVVVRDEAGNKAVYAMKSVTTTTLLDTTPPTPGNSGIITSSANTNTVTLVWSKASDDVSPPAGLQYQILMSTARNIGTVAEAEANGVIVQPYMADINTGTLNGLNSGTTYYFNVIVKDDAGNKAVYSIRSQTTGGKKVTQTTNTNYKNGFFRNGVPLTSDTTPPTPGDSGKILISGVSSSSLTLAWSLATDDLTPEASLQYEVRQSSSENMNTVADAEANGTVLFAFTANISSVVVSRAANAPQYYYTVIVRDDGGNKAIYSTAGSLGLRYTYNANGTKAFQTTSLATSTLSMNHLRISPDQGTIPPAGMAIVRTAPGGKLVSEAGFPLSAGTQSGRVYVETSAATDTADGITTGIAFSNWSAQDAEVSYTFIDAAGNEIRSGLYLLPANQQFSAFLDQSPFNSPNGFKGTFAFTSSIPIGAVAMRGVTNKTGEFLFSALPMAVGSASGDNPILPLFADGAGWFTQVVLMNNSSAAQNGTVQFFGQAAATDAASALQMTVNGVTGTSFNYSIQPRSIARLVTSGSSPAAIGGSIRITPSSQEALGSGAAPDAFAIVSFKNNGTILTETSYSAAPTGTAFRTYVESTTSPEIANSTVAFANPTASTNVVTFQFLQVDGTPVGAATSIALPAGSQMSRFVRELYSGLPEQFRGQLRVTSSAPIAVTAFRTKYNAQGDFMFTPTVVVNEASPSTGVAFPLIATGGGYDTQLVLFGPAGQAGAGEMLLYSKDGIIRTGSSLGIAP